MKTVTDNGGNCPGKEYAHGFCTGECKDGENLVAFLKALKSEAPELEISIA